jgi:hypothetical protein
MYKFKEEAEFFKISIAELSLEFKLIKGVKTGIGLLTGWQYIS